MNEYHVTVIKISNVLRASTASREDAAH